jgi:hypothetical protein
MVYLICLQLYVLYFNGWGGEKLLEAMGFSWFFNVSKSIKFRGVVRPKRMVGMVGSDVWTIVALWKIMG